MTDREGDPRNPGGGGCPEKWSVVRGEAEELW